ncbi:MAG: aminotransferase class III-fold pyridoxal phosphate-dependent enzyme, partial [Nitrosarchaeum sp.]|nr:aminotransferase class III-fold pyridoxal phosphate-dependent enzyme [Nitrosarchaeum sp.]
SGSAHNGISISDGGLDEVSKNTLVVQYNNAEELEHTLKKNRDIAGVIVEPILANMGLILPENNFLADIRKITQEHDVPLIFDEVVTGFRVSAGGAQKHFGIRPDITTLGKALGNGFTIAAVGGRKEIMNLLSPEGKVYQASTFAGNPISVTAAINSVKTINKLKKKMYSKLEKYNLLFTKALDDLASDMSIPHQINSTSSMFQIFFTNNPVIDYTTSKKADAKKFQKLFKTLLKHGIFIAPSQFEVVFFSEAHSQTDLNKALDTYELALKSVKN